MKFLDVLVLIDNFPFWTYPQNNHLVTLFDIYCQYYYHVNTLGIDMYTFIFQNTVNIFSPLVLTSMRSPCFLFAASSFFLSHSVFLFVETCVKKRYSE